MISSVAVKVMIRKIWRSTSVVMCSFFWAGGLIG